MLASPTTTCARPINLCCWRTDGWTCAGTQAIPRARPSAQKFALLPIRLILKMRQSPALALEPRVISSGSTRVSPPPQADSLRYSSSQQAVTRHRYSRPPSGAEAARVRGDRLDPAVLYAAAAQG